MMVTSTPPSPPVDLLKGDFADQSPTDETFHHMMGMSDAIAAAYSQFPDSSDHP